MIGDINAADDKVATLKSIRRWQSTNCSEEITMELTFSLWATLEPESSQKKGMQVSGATSLSMRIALKVLELLYADGESASMFSSGFLFGFIKNRNCVVNQKRN